jgi:hypothetical protein
MQGLAGSCQPHPWNDVPGAQFAGVKPEVLREFRAILERAGVSVTQRVQRRRRFRRVRATAALLHEPENVIPLQTVPYEHPRLTEIPQDVEKKWTSCSPKLK